MAKFAKYDLTPTQTAHWLADRVGTLAIHVGQAFEYNGLPRGSSFHETRAREALSEIRELCDVMEARLSYAAAPQTEEAAA